MSSIVIQSKIYRNDNKSDIPAMDLMTKYISSFLEEYQEIKESQKLEWLQYHRIPTDEKTIPSIEELTILLMEMIVGKIKTRVTDYVIDKEIYYNPELYILFPGWRPVAEVNKPAITEVELPWINWKRNTITDLCDYKRTVPFLESKQLVSAMKEIQSQAIKFTEIEEVISTRMKPAVVDPEAIIAIYNIIRYMLLLIYKFPTDLSLEFISMLSKYIDDSSENMDEPLILYQTIIIALGCEQIERNLMERGSINNKTKVTYVDVCNAYYKNTYWNFDAFILQPSSSWENVIPPDEIIINKHESKSEGI